jgi:hypothetical protein
MQMSANKHEKKKANEKRGNKKLQKQKGREKKKCNKNWWKKKKRKKEREKEQNYYVFHLDLDVRKSLREVQCFSCFLGRFCSTFEGISAHRLQLQCSVAHSSRLSEPHNCSFCLEKKERVNKKGKEREREK